VFEPLCAAECARRDDRATEVVPVLEASIERSAEAIGSGAPFTGVAREFHELVVDLTPNATVRHVVSTLVALWSAQEENWAEVVSRRGEYPSERDAASVVGVHRRILGHIAAGDASEAERIARAHLKATQAYLVDRADAGIVNATSLRARQALAGFGQSEARSW
jgi:DNA-binding FadR family transcriptional regulator